MTHARSMVRLHAMAILLVLAMVTSATAATHYVDAGSTNATSPYLTWQTAATNIQHAVDVATNGATVIVTNGIYDTGTRVTPGYACANRLVITNAITVESVNGPNHTFIVGAEASGGGTGVDAVRGVYMSAGVLSGFTVTNGHPMASGSVNYDRSGGGINLYGGNGLVTNCTLRGNTAAYGGGTHYGTLNACTLTGNAAGEGGGSSYGTLNNCTLTGNMADSFGGGGSYYGTLNACTLTGNAADYDGGGSSNGTLNNCIVYHNTAPFGLNHAGGIFNYSCTTPNPGGVGNISADPILLSASHISKGSPCVGAGSSAYTTGTDIDGDAWHSPPSIGCDESQGPISGELTVAIQAAHTNVVVGHPLTFTGQIEGAPSSNRWTFGDGGSLANVWVSHHTWAGTGDYAVVLTAYNDDHPAGISAAVLVRAVADGDYYVDCSNTNPVPPYVSWATAATNIQDAIAVAGRIAGCTVWVSNGVYDAGTHVTPGYASVNRVVITTDIRVESVNGPNHTFIVGAEASGGMGSNAVRGVYMSAGVLSGFTVRNGHTITNGSVYYDCGGAGINLFGGNGLVTNCTLTDNAAADYGGGSSFGTLNNCTLTGNTAAYYGGGSSFGMLNNCTLTGNTAGEGGGCYWGRLNNCIVYYNMATYGTNYMGGVFNYSCTTPDPSGISNIVTAPMFVDTNAMDHRLLPGSPCIDAGNNAYVSDTTDLAGNPRIMFGRVDMGAYEYVCSSNDYDGDGMDNEAEATATTDQTDPASKLAIIGVDITNSTRVTWIGGREARQILETRTNLLSGSEQWVPIHTNEPTTPVTNNFVHHSATNGPRFYRVRVQEP